MKILIINYYFEPFVGAHAYRWSQIAKVWAAAGHEVNVIAGRVNDIRHEVRDGVAVERIGFVRRQAAVHSPSTGTSGRVSAVRSAAITLLKKVNRFFFWPDGLWHWLPFLLVSLFKHRHEGYDLVVSYSPTFSAHVGGLVYKKFIKNNGRWIADYGDPFSLSDSMPPNNFFLYGWLNRFFEKMVLSVSDYAVFTNRKTRDSYEAYFGCYDLKVIPHAVDFGLFYSSSSFVGRQSDVVKFVYVGNFHEGIREPFETVAIMERFILYAANIGVDLYFDIYGNSNGLDLKSVCGRNIKFHGPIDRFEAVAKMKQADILVHIENSNCLMSPSKVVEYIASGRPILNFHKGEVTEVFRDYEKFLDGFYFEAVADGFSDFESLLMFVLEGRARVARGSDLRRFISPYDLSGISDAYIKLACI